MRRLVRSAIALVGLLVLAGPAQADALPAPAGDVILRVTGNIANGNDGSGALFDLDGLETLPHTQVVTSTPWTEGQTVFDGVLLRDLLAAVGATGENLRAVAINDYAVDIPAEDAVAYDVIVAYQMNGAPMSVRDKGPLWIVYPMDDHDGLKTPETEAKMIWQLRDIAVQ